jgi:pSer/pThr/pTyr-binding forkhead associated (FHA) protein
MAPPVPTPPAPPAAPPAPRSLASVHLVLSNHNTTLPLPEAEQATVGRADPVSKFTPDIDLTSYDGLKSGVGRRHARFQMQNQQITIEDLDSTNGTFLNGRKLSPHTPYPLNNGDNLSLGNMAIIVFIENMA